MTYSRFRIVGIDIPPASKIQGCRVCVITPEFGRPEGRTADPSASLGMTILFGDAKHSFQDEMSSRPERTRISCHAALDKAACAPFCKGKAHEVHQRHRGPQEIRGSEVEGPAVRLSPKQLPALHLHLRQGEPFRAERTGVAQGPAISFLAQLNVKKWESG